MNFKKIGILGTVITALMGFFSIPLMSSCAAPEVIMAKDYPIPPIDAVKPAVTKTATFAMG